MAVSDFARRARAGDELELIDAPALLVETLNHKDKSLQNKQI